jgi:hypothetical protein
MVSTMSRRRAAAEPPVTLPGSTLTEAEPPWLSRLSTSVLRSVAAKCS